MTTDDLDQKTDAELSELFAVEVAEWRRSGIGSMSAQEPPPFATSADAVLPWLEKYICGATKGHARITAVSKDIHEVSVTWRILIAHSLAVGIADFEGCSSSFARAACLAIIRAKRAAK